jgi:hypothetical protein
MFSIETSTTPELPYLKSVPNHTYFKSINYFYYADNEDAIRGSIIFHNKVKDDLKKNTFECKIMRLILNIWYYAHAFPELYKQGVPKNASFDRNSTVIGHNLKITTNETTKKHISEFKKLRETHEISPHFRSAHFRTYKDKRYTNMRFQTIYIAATVVKSLHTKTLLDNNKDKHIEVIEDK